MQPTFSAMAPGTVYIDNDQLIAFSAVYMSMTLSRSRRRVINTDVPLKPSTHPLTVFVEFTVIDPIFSYENLVKYWHICCLKVGQDLFQSFHRFLPNRRSGFDGLFYHSISLVAAGASGFFTLIQSGDRSER
jgi:hypothetical protein